MANGLRLLSLKMAGRERLQKNLQSLGRRIKRRVMRSAATKAARVQRKELKEAAPRRSLRDGTTGKLRKQIKLKVKQYTRGEDVTIFAASGAQGKKFVEFHPRYGAFVRNPVKYFHLWDRGASPHTINGNPLLRWNTNRGKESAVATQVNHPGVEDERKAEKAFNRSKRKAEAIYIKNLRTGINAEANKLPKGP